MRKVKMVMANNIKRKTKNEYTKNKYTKNKNISGLDVPLIFSAMRFLFYDPGKAQNARNSNESHASQGSSSLQSSPGNFAGNNSVLLEIVIGIVLIITQFVLNKSFIGVGYNKWYFDLIFLAFLFLIAINARKDMLKAVLILGGSFYISSFILNHFNILGMLASKLPLFGGSDFSIVLYYSVIIAVSAVFAMAVLKDDNVDVMGYAMCAVASIVIPFALIKFPYSSFLISSNNQGLSLFKLFYS